MSVRVALGLNLSGAKQGSASSQMRLVSADNVVMRSAVAKAEIVHLTNVRPLIHFDVLKDVQWGERGPTQCAFLTGDLVAWQGECGEHLPDELKALVEPSRLNDIFAKSAGYKDKITQALSSDQNSNVRFNTSYNAFYTIDEHRRPKKAFVGAKELVACWWHYVAIEPEMRAFGEDDYARAEPIQYPAMLSKIKAGAHQTQENINKLLYDL